ncbi:hypothetical protein BZA05DRAFT_404433 [Tricharina praecox]|uniref:uncharacterized protein n=1 Tax=Tricharina praecox TaxID=43433 RepID=UPI00221FB9CD|nr:uncharacterized protein BZA05DRAFT_404433 [Tricharina praecox]KAI5848099.1 hypothetical protein BZA05DRAFT_404433 [Tricharina praecox]
MSLLADLLTPQLTSPSSLSLITSILGASGSWYTQSLISHLLLRPTSTTVVHISFLHDATFHRKALPREDARYVFVDGLTGLFRPKKGVLGVKGWAEEVRHRIEDVVESIGGEAKGRVILVLESPDVLLAAGGVGAMELVAEILEWHQLVFATAILVNADSALVSRNACRLEKENAAFVTTLAHQATNVTSLRMLDTGMANDVSGVLRVTGAGAGGEREVLYHIKDSSAEVFNRGQMRT